MPCGKFLVTPYGYKRRHKGRIIGLSMRQSFDERTGMVALADRLGITFVDLIVQALKVLKAHLDAKDAAAAAPSAPPAAQTAH